MAISNAHQAVTTIFQTEERHNGKALKVVASREIAIPDGGGEAVSIAP
jgi:hypothetical protein